MKDKAVIILSGGIDSSTLCYKCVNDGYDVYTLTLNYGQKHKKELNSAEKICLNLKLTPNIVDLSSIKMLLSGSALTDESVLIPEVPETVEHYETLKTTIVPNRNAILLALAVAYGENIGADKIFFGAHHSDRGVYPDCRKEFINAFEKAEKLANDNENLKINAPFVDLNKSEIVKLGSKLGVSYSDTWSCYVGEELHCGVCSSCRERKRAFSEASVEDPTQYKN